MTFDEYQALAARTSAFRWDFSERRTNVAVLGVMDEASEIVGPWKKHVGQEHELDTDKIYEEIGDTLWYLAELCSSLGVSMEVIAIENVEKLKRRFPDGFSGEASINREG